MMKKSYKSIIVRCLMLMLSFMLWMGISPAQRVLAPLKVVVTDMSGNPRAGEKILFVDSVSQKVYSNVTDQKGEFKLKLPSGAVYYIKIKAVGDATEYSTFEIPALNPGEYFDGESVVTIQFEPARTFVLNNVYFDTGKSTLRPSSFAELNDLAEYLKQKPAVRIEIGGHTDDVGDDVSNMKLSQQRADAVKAYLIRKGIDAQRILAKGYGETMPVADNETPEGRQKNRRTEVNILSE